MLYCTEESKKIFYEKDVLISMDPERRSLLNATLVGTTFKGETVEGRNYRKI